MAVRPIVAFVFCAWLGAQDAHIREDAWKGGVPVPAGAVAIVGGLPVPTETFIDEMAARHVRADNTLGRETLVSLVDETLVSNEANKRKATVADADVDCKVQQLDCELRKARTSLDAEIQAKGISLDVFRSKLRKQILLEQLTREDQRIPNGSPVTNEQQKVWLKSRRDAAKIELDRSKLKRGETAVIDGEVIEDVVFTRALLSSTERKDVRKIVDFLIQYTFGMHLLEQTGAPLTNADVEQEFEERKRLFETNPEFRGISFESFVQERTGYDPKGLKASRPFRLNAAVTKLGRKLFGPNDVQGYYDLNLAWFGPRYIVRHLLIRGSDHPLRDQSGKALTQSLAKARQQIEGIRREIDQGKRFEDLIPMYSEHFPTKLRGGLLDAFTVKEPPQGFPELGEAVRKMEIMKLSAPVVTSAGYHLVRVERMEPAPPVEQVEGRIRGQLAAKYFSDALEKAPKGYDIRLD
jgi:peptidyl-prolyl cis-trans isomerase SurA